MPPGAAHAIRSIPLGLPSLRFDLPEMDIGLRAEELLGAGKPPNCLTQAKKRVLMWHAPSGLPPRVHRGSAILRYNI